MELYVIGTLVTALLGVSGKMLWNWKLSVDKKQSDLEKKQQEIVSNYITRFEEIKDKINETEKNILEKISEVNIQIASSISSTRKRRKTS